MRTVTNLIFLTLITLTLGAECEEKRLTDLNECRMELSDGTFLYPYGFPFDVILRDDIQNLDAALDGVREINDAFAPRVVFRSVVSTDQWREISEAPLSSRTQTVTVSEGYAGRGHWDGSALRDDPGGLSTLYWAEDHRISHADVVLSADYTYAAEWVRKGIIHELGHVLSLAHDGNSIDLGSCMSSTPYNNCTLISADVDCVEEGFDRANDLAMAER